MATKKQTAAPEPSRPSVEAILTDIHNTLTESGEAILAKLTEIHEALTAEKTVTSSNPGPTDEVVEKFLRENPKATIADVIRACHAPAYNRVMRIKEKLAKEVGETKPEPKKEEAKPEPEKKPEPKKEEKITVEMLREKISEFAEAFGMNEALAVNEAKGGSRKVSNIPEAKYAAVYKEMQDRLQMKAEVAKANAAQKAKDEAAPAGEPSITKEDIQKVGGAFVKQYGDPAFRELLAKFIEKGKDAKISNVAPAKYAALHEALSNA
jgi:hypothetical protein